MYICMYLIIKINMAKSLLSISQKSTDSISLMISNDGQLQTVLHTKKNPSQMAMHIIQSSYKSSGLLLPTDPLYTYICSVGDKNIS